jgi:hypothetical protein
MSFALGNAPTPCFLNFLLQAIASGVHLNGHDVRLRAWPQSRTGDVDTAPCCRGMWRRIRRGRRRQARTHRDLLLDQDGLRGVSFGNFLIKQSVEELQAELRRQGFDLDRERRMHWRTIPTPSSAAVRSPAPILRSC